MKSASTLTLALRVGAAYYNTARPRKRAIDHELKSHG